MCGISGVFGHPQASTYVLAALRAQQPRGTAATGLGAWMKNGSLHVDKGAGMVNHVFPDMHIHRPLLADHVIGHIRYPTRGGKGTECAQPFKVGKVACCSNGDLPNFDELIKILMEESKAHVPSGNDGELIAAYLNAAWKKYGSREDAIRSFMNNARGSYSVIALMGDVSVAFRDPWGIRPMVIGELPNSGYIVTSETVAQDCVHATNIRQIAPGSAIFFGQHGELPLFKEIVPPRAQAFCFFELIYFSFPSTRVFGTEIATIRRRIGEKLFEEATRVFDSEYIVMAVPDSANLYAEGYSKASGLRVEQGIIRLHHKGRTFILSEGREKAVQDKFAFIADTLRGAKIILLDDSLVRGTTLKGVIATLRSYGVAEIHLLIGSPPNVLPCNLGIDTPTTTELLAAKLDGDANAIGGIVGSDSLRYLSMKGLMACLPPGHSYCTGCVGGSYPEGIPVPA